MQDAVRQHIARGKRTLHVGVHSFSPRLRGEVRRADVGLLYDSASKAEQQICAKWKTALQSAEPSLRVRRNYPYRGDADGLTTYLRGHFEHARAAYLGIELEINQASLVDGVKFEPRVVDAIAQSLAGLVW